MEDYLDLLGGALAVRVVFSSPRKLILVFLIFGRFSSWI